MILLHSFVNSTIMVGEEFLSTEEKVWTFIQLKRLTVNTGFLFYGKLWRYLLNAQHIL